VAGCPEPTAERDAVVSLVRSAGSLDHHRDLPLHLSLIGETADAVTAPATQHEPGPGQDHRAGRAVMPATATKTKSRPYESDSST